MTRFQRLLLQMCSLPKMMPMFQRTQPKISTFSLLQKKIMKSLIRGKFLGCFTVTMKYKEATKTNLNISDILWRVHSRHHIMRQQNWTLNEVFQLSCFHCGKTDTISEEKFLFPTLSFRFSQPVNQSRHAAWTLSDCMNFNSKIKHL